MRERGRVHSGRLRVSRHPARRTPRSIVRHVTWRPYTRYRGPLSLHECRALAARVHVEIMGRRCECGAAVQSGPKTSAAHSLSQRCLSQPLLVTAAMRILRGCAIRAQNGTLELHWGLSQGGARDASAARVHVEIMGRRCECGAAVQSGPETVPSSYTGAFPRAERETPQPQGCTCSVYIHALSGLQASISRKGARRKAEETLAVCRETPQPQGCTSRLPAHRRAHASRTCVSPHPPPQAPPPQASRRAVQSPGAACSCTTGQLGPGAAERAGWRRSAARRKSKRASRTCGARAVGAGLGQRWRTGNERRRHARRGER
jgi:hypothetical protein